MKHLMNLLFIAVMALTVACTSDEKQQVAEQTEQANEQIDPNLAEGVTLKGISMEDGNIVCRMSTENGAALDYLRRNEQMLDSMIAKAFAENSSPQIDAALSLLKATGTDIKILIDAPDSPTFEYTYKAK